MPQLRQLNGVQLVDNAIGMKAGPSRAGLFRFTHAQSEIMIHHKLDKRCDLNGYFSSSEDLSHAVAGSLRFRPRKKLRLATYGTVEQGKGDTLYGRTLQGRELTLIRCFRTKHNLFSGAGSFSGPEE